LRAAAERNRWANGREGNSECAQDSRQCARIST
jgi:hypothetical protein